MLQEDWMSPVSECDSNHKDDRLVSAEYKTYQCFKI